MLSKDHRANREASRRHHRVPRSGMVNKPERIGGIDGVHDMKVRDTPAPQSDAFVAEDVPPARDPTSLTPSAASPHLCCTGLTNDGYAEQTRDSGHPVV